MGLAVRRREEALRPHGRGLRRASSATPTTRSAACSPSSTSRASRENTIVVLVSDNGASGEGGPNGSVNENKFFNGIPDEIEENLQYLDELGSPATYNHYPVGWAWAFNTPFKMWKRYNFEGGVADPMVVSWPKGIDAKGELRHQFLHATDVVPTMYDLLGVEMPEVVKGYPQVPLEGVSFRSTFEGDDVPTPKETGFFSMLGSRAIWHKGWKAVSVHPTITRVGNFDRDRWELYDTAATPPRATTSPPSTPRRSWRWSTCGSTRPGCTTGCR